MPDLNFRQLLENYRHKRDQFHKIVGRFFGDKVQHVIEFSNSVVVGVEYDDLRQINVSMIERPARVQVSFFFKDRPRIDQLSPPSEKDPKTASALLPGTMGMVHTIEEMAKAFVDAGFKITYNPTDARRKEFYAKRLSNMGMEIAPKQPSPGFTWQKRNPA